MFLQQFSGHFDKSELNLESGFFFFRNHTAQSLEHMLLDVGNVVRQNLVGFLLILPGHGFENVAMGGIHGIHKINEKDAAPVFKVEQIEEVFKDFLLNGASG